MNCPKCNNEIDSKTKFCTKCGYNLEEFQKQEKEKKKAEKKEKYYKIKFKIALVLFIILIIAILVLIGLNIFGEKSHETEEYGQLEPQTEENVEELFYEIDEFELTEENKDLDYDEDRLTNEEEMQYGTNVYISDSDGDGLSDYEEVKIHNSDPTRYSTSEDDISDYIKVEKKLDINKKYTKDEIQPEEVEVSSNIKLIPEDIESQYYGGLEQYENDSTVNSTYRVFSLLNFTGTVEYNTNNKDSILLLRDGNEYSEFKNYKNENGNLIITITEEDNYKDLVITTKEKYENYKNSQ